MGRRSQDKSTDTDVSVELTGSCDFSLAFGFFFPPAFLFAREEQETQSVHVLQEQMKDSQRGSKIPLLSIWVTLSL